MKLNIKLLVVLIVGFLITVIGTHFLHEYQVSRNAENLLTRYEAAQADGDLTEATRLLQRYMKYRPDDFEHYKILIQVMYDRFMNLERPSAKDYVPLNSAIETAIRKHEDDVDLRRIAADLTLKVGRVPDAKDHLQMIESLGQSTPEDMIMMARVYVTEAKSEKAAGLLNKLIGYDHEKRSFDVEKAMSPKNLRAYTMSAALYREYRTASRDDETAKLILQQMIDANDDNYEAYLNRARFWVGALARTKPEEARALIAPDVAKAMEMAPDDPNVIIFAADNYLQNKEYQAAEQLLLNRGLAPTQKEKRPVMYDSLARVASLMSQPEKAKEYVTQGLAENNDSTLLLYRRTLNELAEPDIEAAEKTIKRLAKANFSIQQIEYLRARVNISKGENRQAAQRLEQLRTRFGMAESSDIRIDQLLMEVYGKLGKLDKRDEVAKRLMLEGSNVKSEDRERMAILATAESHMQQGRDKEAITLLVGVESELRDKIKNAEDGERHQEQHGRIIKALLTLAIREQGRVPESQRTWNTVDRLVDEVFKHPKIHEITKVQLRLNAMVKKGERSEARALVEQLVDKFPQHVHYHLMLIQMTDDDEQALRLIDLAIARTSDDGIEFALARASRLANINTKESLAKLLDIEKKAAQYSDAQKALLFRNLAYFYQRNKDVPNAKRMFESLTELDSNDLSAYQNLLRIAMQGEPSNEATNQEVRSAMAGIERIAGLSSSEMQIASARRQLWLYKNNNDANYLKRARDLIDKTRRDRPDYALAYELRAEVFKLENNIDGAIASLQTAHSLRPNNEQIIRMLAGALVLGGRQNEALAVLSQLGDSSKTREDRIQEARRLSSQDPKAAVKKLVSIVGESPESPQHKLLLAEMHGIAKDYASAETMFRALVQEDSKNQLAWMGLVEVLIRQEKPDDARALFSTITREVEKPDLLMAQCHAMLNDPEAADFYKRAAENADTESTKEARAYASYLVATKRNGEAVLAMRKLADRKITDSQSASNIRWARRTLAFLMSKSSYQDFKEGIAILEKNATESEGLIGEDLFVWLTLLANRPEPVSRNRALSKLKEIEHQRALTDTESMILARLYKGSGNWSEAQRIWVDVLARSKTNPDLVNQYIDWLLERGDM